MSAADTVGRVLAAPPVRHLLGFAERRTTWPSNRLVVLTYHRVDLPADDGRMPGLVSATPQDFAAQMETLADRFQPVGIETVLAAIAGETVLPERAVLLTFDDGVEDFAHHAWPVLARLGLPAAVFVPTGFVGRPESSFWWDALHAAVTTTDRRVPYDSPIGEVPLATAQERVSAFRELRTHFKSVPYRSVDEEIAKICSDLVVEPPNARVMGWSTLRELSRDGIAVCAHTRSHPHLDRLPLDEVEREVMGSLDDLRRELGTAPPAFAYPGGQLTRAVADVVAGAGVEAAFTTTRGSNRIGACDPLLLRRVNVSPRTGLGAARLRMHPWADRVPNGRPMSERPRDRRPPIERSDS